ncbi:hypothetical protein DACRYDRAFT_54441, partial [Dacryopinax primogenitus]
PDSVVHVDQTPQSGYERIFRHLSPADAESLSLGRVQIINVWSPIRGPVRDAPLAVCHARSVAPGDLVHQRLIYQDRESSTYLVQHNPVHEWYYLSNMSSDEALLIKCYDNKYPHSVTPHTGFVVADTESALPRQSIEVRCLVFFDDDTNKMEVMGTEY